MKTNGFMEAEGSPIEKLEEEAFFFATLQEEEIEDGEAIDAVFQEAITPPDVLDWASVNQAAYDMFLYADTSETQKAALNTLMKLNEAMIYRVKQGIEIRQYQGTMDEDDLDQEVRMAYMESLLDYKARNVKKYPMEIYTIVQNMVRKRLSDTCSAITMPYGTKKRLVREGTYSQQIINVNECECGSDETGYEKRKAAYMSTAESAEDIVVEKMMHQLVINTVKEELAALDPEIRDMILARVAGKKKWAEIGEHYGMTEGGVRFKVGEALDSIRNMYHNMQIESDILDDWSN